jgi:hypothetical protein
MKIISYVLNCIGGGMIGGFSIHGGLLGCVGSIVGMMFVQVGMVINK